MLAGVAALLSCIPTILWISPYSDEGVFGAYSQMLSAGEVPYRDFSLGWNPVAFWLVGGLFRLLGTSYLSLRLVGVSAIILTSVLLARIASRIVTARAAVLTAGVWAAIAAVHLDVAPYHFLESTAAAAATLCLLKVTEGSPRRWLFLAGAAGALCYWLLQPFGLVVPALAVGAMAGGVRLRQTLRYGLGGVVAASVPIFTGLMLTGSLGAWSHQTLFAMLVNYSRANSLPVPWWPISPSFEDSTFLWNSLLALPVLVWIYWLADFVLPLLFVAVAVLGATRFIRVPRPWMIVAVVAVAQFGGALFGRRDARMMWVPAGLALIAAVGLLQLRPVRGRFARQIVSVLMVDAVVVTLIPPLTATLLGCYVPFGLEHRVVVAGSTACADAQEAALYRHVDRLLATHAGDSVAFLPQEGTLYVLARRTPPLSQPFFFRDYNSSAEYGAAERQLIAEHVRWVLYAPLYPGADSPELRGWLHVHYRTVVVYRDGPGHYPATIFFR